MVSCIVGLFTLISVALGYQFQPANVNLQPAQANLQPASVVLQPAGSEDMNLQPAINVQP